MTLFCPNCGTSNDTGARFCAQCGEPLCTETVAPNIAPPKKKTLDSRVTIGIIVAVVAIVLAVCVFMIHVNEKNSPENLIIGEWEADNYWGNTTEKMKFTKDYAIRKSTKSYGDVRTWQYDYYTIDDNVLTLYGGYVDSVEYEFEFIGENTLILTDEDGYDLEFTRIGY